MSKLLLGNPSQAKILISEDHQKLINAFVCMIDNSPRRKHGRKPSNKSSIIVWPHDKSGHVTVKSSYLILSKQLYQTHQYHKIYQSLWHLQIPNIIKFFLWTLINDKLPTKDKLFSKGFLQVNICPLKGHNINI